MSLRANGTWSICRPHGYYSIALNLLLLQVLLPVMRIVLSSPPSSPSIKFSARANPTSPQSPVTPELAQLNNPVHSLPSSSSDMFPFLGAPTGATAVAPLTQ